MSARGQHPRKLTRLIIIGVFIVVAFFMIGAGFLFSGDFRMRREIPFQEVIPFDKGVCVINAGKWYLDKLEVELVTDRGMVERKFYDKDGLCLFKELSDMKRNSIEIRRTDFKGRILYRPLKVGIDYGAKGAKYFVLVGASVGQAWEFPKIPSRLGLGNKLIFGNRTQYDFDKTSVIEALIKLPIKPSGVIIKECAAYFPRELTSSQDLLKKWVIMLRSAGIRLILATTVPVTKEHDIRNPGRFDSLLAFNDFMGKYASEKNIQVLDLEGALRIDASDRHLRNEYAAADGLHLIEEAYREVLDKMVLSVTDEIGRLPFRSVKQ